MLWEPIKRLLSFSPLVWLGSISFEIYLLHLEVIYIFSCRLYGCLDGVPHRLWIIAVITVAISILLAWIYKISISRVNDRCVNSIMNWLTKEKKTYQG